MTFYVFYDEHVGQVDLPGPDEAGNVVDEQEYRIQAHGGRAVALFFGPDGGTDTLRVDLDWDAERAAVRWLPDGSHAVELPPVVPMAVWETLVGLVEVTADLAVMSIPTARAAVVEYVATGQRPTTVRWVATA
jgi:hypothetical protein